MYPATPIGTEIMLREAVQKILISLKLLQDDGDPGCRLRCNVPEVFEITLGAVMDK